MDLFNILAAVLVTGVIVLFAVSVLPFDRMERADPDDESTGWDEGDGGGETDKKPASNGHPNPWDMH